MFKKFSDALTGREIVKLSPDGMLCHHPYFYNKMFTADNRFLVYARVDCSVYCHAMADTKNILMAGDGQQPDKPYIFLANLKEKRETVLCRHDTSWKSYGNTQDSHPHPAFSPDGKKVIFTSDKDGLPGIYMVTI
jgi:dipeptidyl aminopeptidase/acylaminoacyl peptidase